MSTGTLILINPVSGGRAGISLKHTLDRLLIELDLAGSCETALTRADGGQSGAKKIAEYQTVIVAGGDGTVAGIVKQIAASGAKPRLGIIPCGTGNDLARAAGILRYYKKRGLAALLQALLAGSARLLDVFSVNDKLYFTNYCGIGLDAKISNDFNKKRESLIVRATAALGCGRAAYPWFAASNVSYRMPFSLDLTCCGPGGQSRAIKIGAGARQVLVTNISSYAGGARPAPDSSSDDGLFEITVIESLWQWFMLHMTRFFPFRLPMPLPGIVQCRAAELRAGFSGKTCFQADGELYENISVAGLSIRRAAQIELLTV